MIFTAEPWWKSSGVKKIPQGIPTTRLNMVTITNKGINLPDIETKRFGLEISHIDLLFLCIKYFLSVMNFYNHGSDERCYCNADQRNSK